MTTLLSIHTPYIHSYILLFTQLHNHTCANYRSHVYDAVELHSHTTGNTNYNNLQGEYSYVRTSEKITY